MRKEIAPDLTQYGGLKGCSVDHLLVDLLDQVLEQLDSGCPSLVLGVNYEKAFNHLDHHECLAQLERLGATPASVGLVRLFLTDRSMRVRVGQEMSSRHKLKGGSPQGSILGCFLYCATSQQINADVPRVVRPGREGVFSARDPEATPDTPPGPPDPGMGLMEGFQSPGSTDDSFRTAEEAPSPGNLDISEVEIDENERTGSTTVIFKYVDDTTVVMTLPQGTSIRHISSARPVEWLPSEGMSEFLLSLSHKAEGIGMRVNTKKPQLLCVAPDNGYHSRAAFGVGDEGVVIASQETMKLLGYMLGTGPATTSSCCAGSSGPDSGR